MQSKKGRKALVSSEEIFCVLEQYKSEIFDNGVLRGLTHKIWDSLSQELKNKIPKKNLYIYVYQNRYNFQTRLKELLKINDNVAVDEYESNSVESNDGSEKNLVSDGEKMFVLEIAYEKYIEMEPLIV